MNNKQVMAVNCMKSSKTGEKKYHQNVAIAALFDSGYGHLYLL